MRIGGGRERWMVVVPMAVLAGVVTVLLGGPSHAIRVMDGLFHDALREIALFFQR